MLCHIYKLGFVFIFTGVMIYCSPEKNSEFMNHNSFDPSKSDAKAIQIVNEMWQALGGNDNWNRARYLSFRWIIEQDGNPLVDRRHDWDRDSNRYRVEGTNRKGQRFVGIFNTQTKDGEVYLDGGKVTIDSTKNQMLKNAYRSFINDSYWLLMPHKLNDPGVILSYEGEKELNGQSYDVIKVTFENVGLTPGDMYWAYIDKTDRLMHKWEYILERYPQDREPSGAWWKDWQPFGGVQLAMNREIEGRDVRIYFKDVVVSPEVDESVFELTGKTF
ncbi:MAG: DUF6503 family protein [bacterium]